MMLSNTQIDAMDFETLCNHLRENPQHVPLVIIRISSTSFARGVQHGEDKMMRMLMNMQRKKEDGAQ